MVTLGGIIFLSLLVSGAYCLGQSREPAEETDEQRREKLGWSIVEGQMRDTTRIGRRK